MFIEFNDLFNSGQKKGALPKKQAHQMRIYTDPVKTALVAHWALIWICRLDFSPPIETGDTA